jgi:hypothetical protein
VPVARCAWRTSDERGQPPAHDTSGGGKEMPVTGVTKFEHLFRSAASIDVDRNDLKRYQEFINQKLYDLLIIGQAAAKANGRDVIETRDLPITKGLQESIDGFERIDSEVGLSPILDYLIARPPDVALSEEAQARLPGIAGGMSVALGRTFKVIDPAVKRPMHKDWEQAFRIFDLLL